MIETEKGPTLVHRFGLRFGELGETIVLIFVEPFICAGDLSYVLCLFVARRIAWKDYFDTHDGFEY